MQIAWITIFMRAFCNIRSNFHMEKTATEKTTRMKVDKNYFSVISPVN